MTEKGAQFKFDKSNPEHVQALTKGDVEVFPGGLMAFRTPSKISKSTAKPKAVAPKKSKMETKISQSKVKKVPKFLASARSLENESRKRGEITEGLKNPKDDK